MKRTLILCIATTLAVGFTEASARAAEPDFVEMATMTDGVSLSTAVYLPDQGVFPGPYQTVMLRTPYPDILGQVDPKVADQIFSYVVDLFGLALVIQDTRGTGVSEGEADAFFSEWKDGPDTVDWITRQEWSNGQVLQFGLSALAIPGYLAAPNTQDAMMCQFLGEAAPDMYNLAAFHGGVFKKETVEDWLSWVDATSMLSALSEHRDCDEFWDPLMLDRIPGDIHAAAMHMGGWYDVFTEGTIAGFKAYVDRGDDWAAAHQYLVIGPWDHWTLAAALGGTATSGYSMQNDLLAWISFCLAGDTSTISEWPHVRYYVMGSTEEGAPGNEWRGSPDWPLVTEYRAFSLTGEGLLVDSDDAAGRVAARDLDASTSDVDDAGADDADTSEPVEPVLPAVLPFNHADYSPVVGGRNLTGSSGCAELSKVLGRDDYVMFQTEPLDEPFESIGRMSAVLDVSTKYKDADVIVRLADVYPDGSAWLLSDGAARLSRRGGCEQAVDVEPDQIYELDVDLLSSAMVFNTGHRIAVIVTSTLYPKYELNPALEAESRANAPLDSAFVVYGGRLMMPVASPVTEPPETVETVEIADVYEPADAGNDLVAPDAFDSDVSGDVAAADAGPIGDGSVARDASLHDQGFAELEVPEDAAAGDSGIVQRVGGGCSAGGPVGASSPFALLPLLLVGVVLCVRRFSH